MLTLEAHQKYGDHGGTLNFIHIHACFINSKIHFDTF